MNYLFTKIIYTISGEAHTSYNNKVKPSREPSKIQCRCRCLTKFTEDELELISSAFNNLKDHEAQNIYLQGCISINPLESIRRRPRKEVAKERSSFSYTVTVKDKSIAICKAAFLAVHGIKNSRLKRKVMNFSVPIADGRGKHGKHKKIDKSIRDKVCEHIRMFPARESHYSRSKNKHTKYLDSSLTVAEMHRLFLQENPDLADVKYWYYHDIFNFEFNIKFGFPRSDICDKCEKFQAQIKAAESVADVVLVNDLKSQHELHIRKADVFNVQMNEATEAAKQSKDTAVICMDFEKNLPLPLHGIG